MGGFRNTKVRVSSRSPHHGPEPGLAVFLRPYFARVAENVTWRGRPTSSILFLFTTVAKSKQTTQYPSAPQSALMVLCRRRTL